MIFMQNKFHSGVTPDTINRDTRKAVIVQFFADLYNSCDEYCNKRTACYTRAEDGSFVACQYEDICRKRGNVPVFTEEFISQVFDDLYPEEA